ncbi:histidine kinase [Crossiella sp. SN42]|uniref:sensor histidine kinase n=1 Tax=Crossiella sp. SN42 TaxID=2944808 RepID=UPI00207CAECC|nr:histidine kinase [Crossiella sp. SN42]MCO1577715.1 histidine kinase [Crossiella sp. SN42]
MRLLPFVTAAARIGAGLALGALSALAELGYLVLAGLLHLSLLLWPSARQRSAERLEKGARRLSRLEGRRVARFFGGGEVEDDRQRRPWMYLLVRVPVGLAVGVILLLLVYGVLTAVASVGAWITGGSIFTGNPAGRVTTESLLALSLPGLVLLYLALQGLYALSIVERRLVREFLGLSPEELRQRIQSLTETRAGIVQAVDAERRRIERDLHDGVQQRLVALGLLIGRARRGGDAARAETLLAQAHQECQEILNDLREVAWRVYPTALDNLGLPEAIARVVEGSPLRTTVSCQLPPERPPARVEAAAYFIVCEAVTNATKHANAATLDVRLTHLASTGTLLVEVADDGVGGADPDGGGLSGLAQRVAAMDGEFRVRSPLGGGTLIGASLPCA